MKATIRKIKEEELQIVYEFERSYIIEHEPDQLEKWDDAKERIFETLKSYTNTMFVAVVDEQVVGHGYWGMYEGLPCVYSLYIDKDHRKGGLGFALMERLDKDIEEKGHKISSLATLVTNPAQYLFEKAGYERTDEKDGWIQFEKNFED